MKQKSITFRCSANQNKRLAEALNSTSLTRTEFITSALECFLAYSEHESIRAKDLFELVQDIDARSNGPSFADQA